MPAKSKKTKSSQHGPTSKPTPVSIPKEVLQTRPQPIEDPISPPLEQDSRTGDTTESAGEPTPLPSVNRKKQKRREKEAAKRIAEEQAQMTNGHARIPLQENGYVGATKQGRGPVKGYFTEDTDYVDPDFDNQLPEGEEEFFSNDDDIEYAGSYAEGPDHSWLNTSKRKKGSKSRPRPHPAPHSNSSLQRPFPTLSNDALRSAHKMSNANDHIWNTSTQAERENIKQFWLELGEDERRSLVRVEKEAVLRKMKEQQKHSCQCSVCGRKRTAIEEELEVLYDAYYSELEQFANHDDDSDSPRPAMHPRYPAHRRQHPMAGAYPVQGRVQELGDDGEELDDEEDEYDEEEDDDEEDEDDYSDEYEDELPPGSADFFQFGQSLTVKDGILTVADDLLKNDGKHFIDMMEQLAERRMQRHNHPPIDEDDDYDDEEDDEDYDSQEEDDFEGDEMDSMTESQRMEEGRRMFQIFAARMFEQRVLTAYKEKVAAERQKKLLEELEAEDERDAQREAKKAREAAKKKEKKARQKAVKDEEKAKKDAEKAAQEAALREAEERKTAEKRAKQEEQRKKRDAERKAAEEDRLRKEAERVQRAQKERERQQETERKAKEAKEKEKRQREEQRKREREDREAKEAEARERRLKEEQEKREKEALLRKEKDLAAKADREARERHKAEQASKPQPVALPPGLGPSARNPSLQSPHVPPANPIVPINIPNPTNRSRQTSQPSQQSHSSSPRSQKASTEGPRSQASMSPANAPTPQHPVINQPPKHIRQGPPLHHPQPNAPRSPLNNMGHMGRGGHMPPPYGNLHGIGVNGIPTTMPGQMQMNGPMHMYPGPPVTAHQRYPPNGLPFPPGFNGPRPFQPNQHLNFHHQPPPQLNGPALTPQPQVIAPPVHSRQPSGSDSTSQPAPIARPGPIARPSSTTPDKQRGDSDTADEAVEQLTNHLGSSALLGSSAPLGSSALLDDSDGPFANQLDNRSSNIPLAPPGTGRLAFASTFGTDKPAHFGMPGSSWSSFSNGPTASFGHTPRPAQGWPQPLFDPMGGQTGIVRPHVPRPIAVRLMLIQAYRQLSSSSGGKADGYYPAQDLLRRVQQLQQSGEPSVELDELLGICDTEGNVQNGGGTFEVMVDNNGQIIKFLEDSKPGVGYRGGLGDIGNPIMAPGHQISSFGSIGQGVQHQGFRPQQQAPGRSY